MPIPWLVAMALQADGWWLRSDIIWHKPNPMPESITDRPTKAHEYVFLLSKAATYYYDAEAVREDARPWNSSVGFNEAGQSLRNVEGRIGKRADIEQSGRNRRSVWTVATRPYAEAHFAVWPTALVTPMIQAGTSERGACADCGAPWRRASRRSLIPNDPTRPQAIRAMALAKDAGLTDGHIRAIQATGITDVGKARVTQSGTDKNTDEVKRLAAEAKAALGGYFREFMTTGSETTGWSPTCGCETTDRRPCIVLDPFMGSGTTAQVAQDLGRDWIGCELNEDYAGLQDKRTAQASLFGLGAS